MVSGKFNTTTDCFILETITRLFRLLKIGKKVRTIYHVTYDRHTKPRSCLKRDLKCRTHPLSLNRKAKETVGHGQVNIPYKCPLDCSQLSKINYTQKKKISSFLRHFYPRTIDQKDQSEV